MAHQRRPTLTMPLDGLPQRQTPAATRCLSPLTRLDRLIQRTYPDGTSDRYTYKTLDLVAVTDRLGRTTSYAYDADHKPISTTDALGNKTTRTYYENGALKTLTDANGNTTSWNINVEGRVTREDISRRRPASHEL